MNANLNNTKDNVYEQLLKCAHEYESNVSDLSNLVYDASFYGESGNEKLIKEKVKKAHEAIEVFQAQLLISLEMHSQKEEV